MAYTLPQVLVYQEFQEIPTAITDPLRAHIAGGNAILFRYDDSEEKLLSSLGAYDPDSDEDFLYPNRPTGGIVDQDYITLRGDDVLLRYFEDNIGADSTVAPVAGKLNRVRSDAVNFADNTANDITYARDAALLDRDVQVGDVVDISAVVATELESLRAEVIDIEGDTIDDTIDAAVDDDNNAADQAASDSVAQTVGPFNCIEPTVDASAYDGTADGDINETYTVKVTTGSLDGDLTTARLQVRSASGNDDADNAVVAAAAADTAIGARGLVLVFDNVGGSSCSAEAAEEEVSAIDLIKGQTWVVTVAQEHTAAEATSGGDYTGDANTTYIVEISRGGEIGGATAPQITVSTIHGIDVSGPTNVTAVDTAVAVGTGGVTVSFGGVGVTHLRGGDLYYIGVIAEAEGPMRTLVLSKNMNAALATAADLDLTLYIPKDGVEIPKNRTGAAPLVNYELGDPGINDTGFTVKSGVTLYDPTWTDGGEEQALPVAEANLFLEYRAWVCDKGNAVYTIDDVSDLTDIPGELDPDNPLKWGVFKALENANGSQVKYTAVCDPDDSQEWIDVLALLKGRRDVYGLVPLTHDATILGLYEAHVDAQSAADKGRWRVVWEALTAESTVSVVDDTNSSDGAVVLAEVADDPDVGGDQFTIVNIPAGNADFVTNGVQAGDLMRFNFVTDGWDGETYDEYIIDQVLNEDSLRLKTGQGTVEVLVAKKMEVYRNLDTEALADQIAGKAAAKSNRRIRTVWPDQVGSGGLTYDGYFLACSLAGLRSGSPPNQGLTNTEVAGYDDMSRSQDLFSRDQLDTLAEAGVWIVAENEDGNIVTRHALTTAGFGDLLTQEEMVTANVDSMSFLFLSRVEDMIGRWNVTPSTIEVVQLRLEGTIEFFKEVRVARIGGQLIEGEVTDIRQHAILKDRIVAELLLTVPVPLNNIEEHLQIVV